MKIAIKTFHGPNRLTVMAGEAFADDADVVKKYPAMFGDVADVAMNRRVRSHKARPVQDATARPGEKSDARALKPRKKKADKKDDKDEKEGEPEKGEES